MKQKSKRCIFHFEWHRHFMHAEEWKSSIDSFSDSDKPITCLLHCRPTNALVTMGVVGDACTGQHSGYRTIWRLLRTRYGIRISREVVRQYLHFRDPTAVANRRARRLHRRTYYCRGPNDQWHFDGYDKLKKYGIAVSGCVDGYSRRVIWLRCSSSNNDPRVIGCYYLDAVQELHVCPRGLRSDRGSENCITAAIHCCLTHNASGHAFVASTSNQRIESFWGNLRRLRVQWWIDLFEDMISCGLVDLSIMNHIECVRYCFMNVVQNDLNNFVSFWNCHRIRHSPGAGCPAGIPDELYFLPADGTHDCGVLVLPDAASVYNIHITQPTVCASDTVQEYLDYLRHFYSLEMPVIWQEAVALLIRLISHMWRSIIH